MDFIKDGLLVLVFVILGIIVVSIIVFIIAQGVQGAKEESKFYKKADEEVSYIENLKKQIEEEKQQMASEGQKTNEKTIQTKT